MQKIFWNDESTTPAIALDSAGTISPISMGSLIYRMRENDEHSLMLELPPTWSDIYHDAEAVMTLDALVVSFGKMKRMSEFLNSQMVRAGKSRKDGNGNELTVSSFAVGDKPVKQAGTTNIICQYRLNDGQAVTVYFHNPDSKPNQLAATDDMVAWKWLLNRKDITIAVAPERGKDLNIKTVASRIMAIAEKNSPAFIKANEKKLALTGLEDKFAKKKGELSTKEADLLELEVKTNAVLEGIIPDGYEVEAQNDEQIPDDAELAPEIIEPTIEPVTIEPEKPPFTPTHTLRDGTPVKATDEAGVYEDANGNENEDSEAEAIVGESEAVNEVADNIPPMLKAYREAKAANPNSFVLMRVGDFYEAFEDDAATIASLAELTLTKRTWGASEGFSMTGFPFHTTDEYANKLANASGKKVVTVGRDGSVVGVYDAKAEEPQSEAEPPKAENFSSGAEYQAAISKWRKDNKSTAVNMADPTADKVIKLRKKLDNANKRLAAQQKIIDNPGTMPVVIPQEAARNIEKEIAGIKKELDSAIEEYQLAKSQPEVAPETTNEPEISKNPVSVDALVAIGGKKWESSDKSKSRVYFGTDFIAKAKGFEYTTYKTGNISSASLKGESLSNSKAKSLLSSIASGKFWYDVNSREFVSDGFPNSHAEIEAFIRESLKSVNIPEKGEPSESQEATSTEKKGDDELFIAQLVSDLESNGFILGNPNKRRPWLKEMGKGDWMLTILDKSGKYESVYGEKVNTSRIEVLNEATDDSTVIKFGVNSGDSMTAHDVAAKVMNIVEADDIYNMITGESNEPEITEENAAVADPVENTENPHVATLQAIVNGDMDNENVKSIREKMKVAVDGLKAAGIDSEYDNLLGEVAKKYTALKKVNR